MNAPPVRSGAVGIRTMAAVLAGKSAAAMSRRLGRGGGTALPGLLAERIDPHIVERLAGQVVASKTLVTGTNGKTTTARLLGAILRASGREPLRNAAGSNLMRGLAASLLDEAGVAARVPVDRPAVFEVDEATLHQAARAVDPDVIVFTNLFRDQLDRYGEIDSVADVWRRTIAQLPADATIVLNADDPLVSRLAGETQARVLTYGIDDAGVALGAAEHAADSRWCPRCGKDYAYDALFFGHIGWWRCPQCDDRRRPPDVAARDIVLEGDDRARFTLVAGHERQPVELPLAGLYNVENALAAAAGSVVLGVAPATIAQGLGAADAAFGRQERLIVGGREVRLLLGKNPAGLNQALRTIAAADGPKNLVFILNDDIADGTDVSWIWDVDYEIVAPCAAAVTAAGRRAEDMALRLKYAGFGDIAVSRDLAAALRGALDREPRHGPLHVLPTYTAMLEARELLGRWANAGHFWERAS